MSRIIFLLISLLLITPHNSESKTISENFADKALMMKNWQAWGEASVRHDNTMGSPERGSVSLHSEDAKEATLYRKFTDLKGPYVRVQFSIRADRVGLNQASEGFSHFYQTNQNSIIPVKSDFAGSFEWSTVSYTLPVSSGQLELWFRLKAAGTVWLDDFELLDGQAQSQQLAFSPRPKLADKPFSLTADKKCLVKSPPQRKVIYSPGKDGFTAKINSQKYHELDISRWSSLAAHEYDFLEFTIEIPANVGALALYFVIADAKSQGYWGQLNHSQTVSGGVHKVSVALKQDVGERGSQREKRQIDYQNLRKVYLVLDPDKKAKVVDEIKVSAIELIKLPRPALFKDLYAFDFTDQESNSFECFRPVTARHIKGSRDQYGLVLDSPVRVHDSVYADQLNRTVLGISDGVFEVELPNGEYNLALNWNMLGYWDVPFWNRRYVEIQGRPLKLEVRSKASDYLRDYLRFELLEPMPDDHPWDLYLKEIFRPIEGSFKVTNGKLQLRFEGDETGVSLNSLLIWPKGSNQLATKFRNELAQRQRLEFDQTSHYVLNPKEMNAKESLNPRKFVLLKDLSRVGALQDLGVLKKREQVRETLFLNDQALFSVVSAGGREEEVKFDFEIDSDHIELQVFRGVHQYLSIDRNHQTYTVAPHILAPVSDFKSTVRGGVNEQFFFKLKSKKGIKAGLYSGKLVVSVGTKQFQIPLEVRAISESLPQVDFAVGFLGLQSVGYHYFKGTQTRSSRLQYAQKALAALSERGFTTWSGLPSAVGENGADTSEIQQLLALSRSYGIKGKVFTYSGHFPYEFLTDNEQELLQKRALLQSTLNPKLGPKIVFNFSDEAAGYSQNVSQDQKRGQFLKKHFPKLVLGGFSQVDKKGSAFELNRYFDEGSYSNYLRPEMERLQKVGKSWGLYNQIEQPLDNPRILFSLGLYQARALGASHLLEWHLSAVHNYPYYDLDGRENDAMMLYPTSNGDLLSTVKFEQAAQGLREYRLLLLLESRKDSMITQFKKQILGQGNSVNFTAATKERMRWLNTLSEHVFTQIR